MNKTFDPYAQLGALDQKLFTKENQSKRTDEHLNERTGERKVKRQSFDVYEDQMISLADLQTDIFKKTGKRPTFGELARQIFDDYLKKK